jgi:hypothetical protein
MFFEFIECEYQPLHQSKEIKETRSLVDRMLFANMLDSDSHKAFRRQAFSTMSSFLDMFRRSDGLRQVPRIAEFQSLLLTLLNTVDTKSQKTALDCLVKSGYKAGLMSKYKKLMDGFVDDEKFKDMIPILIHGSQANSGAGDVPEEYQETDADNKVQQKAKRKETKSVIPKLDEEDREAMLPVIIKLLQSKLLMKKGAINKKSLHVRRAIVYKFFASLNPDTEFAVFFDELLRPINLKLVDNDIDQIRQSVSSVSFNTLLSFINSLEVVFKQMGTLLIDHLPGLSQILVEGILHLTKLFIERFKTDGMQVDEQVHYGSLK